MAVKILAKATAIAVTLAARHMQLANFTVNASYSAVLTPTYTATAVPSYSPSPSYSQAPSLSYSQVPSLSYSQAATASASATASVTAKATVASLPQVNVFNLITEQQWAYILVPCITFALFTIYCNIQQHMRANTLEYQLQQYQIQRQQNPMHSTVRGVFAGPDQFNHV